MSIGVGTDLHHRVTHTFAELADTLVEPFDNIEFLHILTDRCVELLPVDAAGIALAGDDGLALTAASSSQKRLLDHLLARQGDDPSEECVHSGQMVRCPDLRVSPRRWPRFTAAALSLGFVAVDAVPMRLRGDVIGSLMLFRAAPGALSDEAVALARTFANVATIGLLQARTPGGAAAVQLRSATAERVAVERAKGVLVERLEIGVADAFSLMRNYARNTGLPLAEVAKLVNERSPEIAGLTRVSKPYPRW